MDEKYLINDDRFSSSFKTKIGFSFKELIELIYTPDKKNSSSSLPRPR